ncbi:MAG: hypothetical protein FJW39_20135 [Acidobacteria bacterium]|nr:hypothetical protein [Acidobacteriota bacterium]
MQETPRWTLIDRSIPGLIAGLLLGVAGVKIFLWPAARFGYDAVMGKSSFLGSLPGLALAAIIGIPFLSIGWWLALGRVVYHVDAAQRQLVRRTDFLLVRTESRYPYSHFKRLRIEDSASGGRIKRPSVTVTAESSSSDLVLCAESTAETERCRARARQLARIMHVPVEDRVQRG